MPHSVRASPQLAELPYWQVNVPPHQRTKRCPAYLLEQSEKNQRILATRDEHFRRQMWPEVQEIARTNRIDLFQRVPSDLRRYLKYIYDLKRTYGSVLAFVQLERLHWLSDTPSGHPPFTAPSDYKILYNDWPYGIDTDVAHLVVWTKFRLEDDPATDDLTPKARAEIEEFVERTFCDASNGGLEKDRVIWFKNWRSLKSVHALEHFHVMLYKAETEFLARIMDGDRPMCEKLGDNGDIDAGFGRVKGRCSIEQTID